MSAVELDRRTTQANRESGCLRLLPSCNAVLRRVLTAAYASALDLGRFDAPRSSIAHPQSAAPGGADQGWSRRKLDDTVEGLRLARAALQSDANNATVLCLAGHTIAELAADFTGGAVVGAQPELRTAWMRSGHGARLPE